MPVLESRQAPSVSSRPTAELAATPPVSRTMTPRRVLALSLVLILSIVVALAPPAVADAETDRRCSVVSAGDVNGDGACDLALAERGPGAFDFLEPGPEPKLDRVWILSGKDGALLRTLRPPRDCPAFGRALENVGDLDADGVPELAISGGGPLWVFSGADGSVRFELAGKLASPGFGRSLDGGEDVDGDAIPDLVVFRSPRKGYEPERGLVLLYSGRTGELIRALGGGRGFPRSDVGGSGAGLNGGLGVTRILDAVGLVPDRDGDGRAELAVCAVPESSTEGGDRPAVLEVLDPLTLEVHQCSVLPESCAPDSSSCPWVIRTLGDVDGDEVDELLLSIINDYVLLYSGATGAELRRHDYIGAYMNAEGTSLDVIGDLDGDGVAEYLIGANEEIDVDWGFAGVFSGATGQVLHSLEGGLLEEIPDRALPCEPRTYKDLGIDTCALGDTNGDGMPDVAVHLPAAEEVRILSGVDFEPLVTVRSSPLLMHNVEK